MNMQPHLNAYMALVKWSRHATTVAAAVPRQIITSFRAKVIALVVLSVLVPSSLIWFFTVENTERFQTERTRDRFDEVMNDAVRDIGFWYRERLTDIDRLLASTAFRRPLSDLMQSNRDNAQLATYRSEIEHYLNIVRDRFPVYEAFVVADADGSVIWASPGIEMSALSIAGERTALGAGAALATPPMLDPDRRSAHQWVAVPVDMDPFGSATVYTRMDLGLLGAELTSHDDVLDKYLVTPDGVLITTPRFAANTPDGALVGTRFDFIPSTTADGDIDRYDRDMVTTDGKRSRVAFIGSRAAVPGQQFWVVCEAEESRFIAPTLTRKNRVLVANTLICVLFLLAAWHLSQYLLEPLRKLRLGAQRINEGMAGVHIEPGGNNDEITDMIHAFNDMAKKISVSQAELNAKAKLLQVKNSELAQTNDSLEQLSVTDGLTGLFNHRHFWTLVDQETSSDSSTKTLALILLDIDDFKLVNDQYGHAIGDVLITKVADVLREVVRASDFISRYGGEEYAVLLPRTTLDGALSLSEKIRDAIARFRLIVPDTGVALSVTVSIGVSLFNGDKAEFFNAADRALYLSKAEGKNCVRYEAVGE